MMSLEKRTSLYVNSFPRTGNTYMQQSLQSIINNNKMYYIDFASHTHDHLLLLNNDINQVASLRNPLDTIASFIIMHINPSNKKHLEKVIKELDYLINEHTKLYISFINNMTKSNSLFVIKFEDLITKNINDTCLNIFNYFDIPFSKDIKLLDNVIIENNINNNKKRHNDSVYSLNYPRDYSNIPEREFILETVKNSAYYYKAYEDYIKVSDYFNKI